MGMGAADVVPGVSGGTIAFISGIYETLINSINSIDGKAIKLLSQFKIKELWDHVNGNFLVVLLSGIIFSIVSLSALILFLLTEYPEIVWSFFFGLIVASAVIILPKVTKWTLPVVISGIIGAAIAYYVSIASTTQTPEALWFIFLSGALAICAMILPGISGSFILLLLGKYEYILGSLKELKIAVILTFVFGCVAGLLSFARLLKFLLANYHNLFVSLLTGFMVGSLNKVWPWKETITSITNRHGKIVPILQENVSPFTYDNLPDKEPYLLGCIIFAVVGFALIIGLNSLSEKKGQKV